MVLAGVIPLDRTASWSSTNDEKRSWLGGKPVVVSAGGGCKSERASERGRS